MRENEEETGVRKRCSVTLDTKQGILRHANTYMSA